jgi:predicted TIM-barrel fold metal-dependent hydrolase
MTAFETPRRVAAIDCLIHPFPASDPEFARYLPSPIDLRMRSFGAVFNRGVVTPAFPEYLPGSVEDGGFPGSSVELLRRTLAASGIDVGVLVPLTRGLLPDMRKGAAVAAATNAWLADTWLGEAGDGPALRGSIRVAARHPQAAVAEIEKWAGDERFVQVSVPLEAVAPYGQEQYFPIWEAAAHFGLPVMVVSDRGRGIGFPLTPLGNPPFYAEAACQVPVAGALHLASLVTEGVLDRLPDLRFVFGDGGFDALTLLQWRVTNDWRAGRVEAPWASKAPIDYLGDHVHFVLHPFDGPDDPERFGTLVELADAGERLLFGSRWPYWDALDGPTVRQIVGDDRHAAVMGGNAAALYSRL